MHVARCCVMFKCTLQCTLLCITITCLMVLALQDYFAGLLVDHIKLQSPGPDFRQALQGVLANLQSLYQHNQLIFQVWILHTVLYYPQIPDTNFDSTWQINAALHDVGLRFYAKSHTSRRQYCASTQIIEEAADHMADASTSPLGCSVWIQDSATRLTQFLVPLTAD